MRKTDITEFCEYNIEMAENYNPIAFAKWIPLYSQEYVSALENDLNILSKELVKFAMAVGTATQEIHSLKRILNKILDNDGSRKIYNATQLILARDLAEELLGDYKE